MEHRGAERLGEDVGQLMGSFDVSQLNLLVVHNFAQESDARGTVLETLARGSGFREKDGGLVVAEKDDGHGRREADESPTRSPGSGP